MKGMIKQRIADVYTEVIKLANMGDPNNEIFDKLHLAYMAMLIECDQMPNMVKMINECEQLTISHVTAIMYKKQVA